MKFAKFSASRMGAFVSERIPVEPRILRWAREFAGLPEEEAARRIGVSAEKLSDWEEGVSSPTIPVGRHGKNDINQAFPPWAQR